jgi:hypothetical protein
LRCSRFSRARASGSPLQFCEHDTGADGGAPDIEGELQLHWQKSATGDWYRLDEVELRGPDAYGVFVVWRPGEGGPSVVLYVGRGVLQTAIAAYRRDPVINRALELRITWAAVDPRDAVGVAAYLYQRLRPLWGEVPQGVPALPVNLPLTV